MASFRLKLQIGKVTRDAVCPVATSFATARSAASSLIWSTKSFLCSEFLLFFQQPNDRVDGRRKVCWRLAVGAPQVFKEGSQYAHCRYLLDHQLGLGVVVPERQAKRRCPKANSSVASRHGWSLDGIEILELVLQNSAVIALGYRRSSVLPTWHSGETVGGLAEIERGRVLAVACIPCGNLAEPMRSGRAALALVLIGLHPLIRPRPSHPLGRRFHISFGGQWSGAAEGAAGLSCFRVELRRGLKVSFVQLRHG